jgi:HK97 family phage portal protein
MTISDNHPLLLENLKAAYSPSDYIGATVRTIDGYGSKGAKPRPFNQNAAVRQFGGWVYKAALLNANAVGRIPLRLYVKRRKTGRKLYGTSPVKQKRARYLRGDGRAVPSLFVSAKVAEWDGDFEEVTEPHPVLRLLNKPNPWTNGFQFAQARMIYLQLAGNAYTFKVLDPVLGVPAQLWPMAPQNVEIKPSKTAFIDGYVYGTDRENQKTFLPDEVIHAKLHEDPKQPYYGMGCVEAVWTALGLHASKRVMDQAKFDNMNRPDWFIAFDGAVKPEALERLRSPHRREVQGAEQEREVPRPRRQGHDPSAQPGTDGDRRRRPHRRGDRRGFGVPVSMLKASDPNRASAQTADTAWLRDTVRPLALATRRRSTRNCSASSTSATTRSSPTTRSASKTRRPFAATPPPP